MARDPVCGMEVDPDRSDWVTEHNGTDVYFSSESCQTAFNRDPVYFSQVNQMGLNHNSRNIGGRCGSGTTSGWMVYARLAIMVALILSLFLRWEWQRDITIKENTTQKLEAQIKELREWLRAMTGRIEELEANSFQLTDQEEVFLIAVPKRESNPL